MRDMNMNLVEMMKDFSDESKCRAYLEALRWPKGVTCPHCKAVKVYRIRRDQFVCASCEYQFSVTVDTIFHDTHLPLVTWFLATILLCEAKKGMSACQIQRSLGIKTYKTALPGSEATVRGFSAVSLLLVDEASRVEDEMYLAIRPMLAVSEGTLWLMSTPYGKRGFFWEAWERGGPEWERVRVPATECPRIRPEFLEEERRAMG